MAGVFVEIIRPFIKAIVEQYTKCFEKNNLKPAVAAILILAIIKFK